MPGVFAARLKHVTDSSFLENLVGSPSQPRPVVAWKGGDHYTRRTAIGVVMACKV